MVTSTKKLKVAIQRMLDGLVFLPVDDVPAGMKYLKYNMPKLTWTTKHFPNC